MDRNWGRIDVIKRLSIWAIVSFMIGILFVGSAAAIAEPSAWRLEGLGVPGGMAEWIRDLARGLKDLNLEQRIGAARSIREQVMEQNGEESEGGIPSAIMDKLQNMERVGSIFRWIRAWMQRDPAFSRFGTQMSSGARQQVFRWAYGEGECDTGGLGDQNRIGGGSLQIGPHGTPACDGGMVRSRARL